MFSKHNFINFHVKPQIPESLSYLLELAYNVWTTWDKDAYELFSRIDPNLFRKCEHNPVQLLASISNSRLVELSQDSGFIFEMKKVYTSFINYWNFSETTNICDDKLWTVEHGKKVAYLCMEYGMHESIPIYSGGLGILAGDHLKAASDQGIPLTAFGLLYKYGYFNQKIRPDGMQEENYTLIDWETKPVNEVKNLQGEDLVLKINYDKGEIFLKVWKINVGKVELYLLDSDIDPNPQNIKDVTHRLYEADKDKRILQEIILAWGSMKLMDEINFQPTIYHLNEGHSAFIIIELLRKYIMEKKYSFEEASELIKASTVFTTHTPIADGNEHFDKKLVEKYLKDKINQSGITFDKFNELASLERDTNNYWLPALAIRFSNYNNGVSKLHAHVSREMWNSLYPNLPECEIPITHITNGVHLQTWMSKQLTILFNRYVGPEYLHASEKKAVWNSIFNIPDTEIWEAHRQRKEQMISFIRSRIARIERERGIITSEVKNNQLLNSNWLTIGFARRFAQYKRANLLLTNPQRLLSILKNEERPVQFIFAGKAHPADVEGKKLIRNIIEFARQNEVEDRFLFIEGYDINVARNIVQGCDVWLNTPVKPMEASGTSGMKAGLNGVLNFSVPDGWWPECFDGTNGWEINAGDFYADYHTAHNMEAEQIYDLIEHQIAKVYYDKDKFGYPYKWINMMKRSIYTVGMNFNMHRMVDEYVTKFYLPAINAFARLTAHKDKELKAMIKTRNNVLEYWDRIYIKDVFVHFADQKAVISGEEIRVETYVFLADAPKDLFTVEIFYQYDDIDYYETIPMYYTEAYPDQVVKFERSFFIKSSGSQNINVRIRPTAMQCPGTECQLIKWRMK